MEHVKALGMKFVMLAVVLGIILTLIFDVSFGDAMLTALVLTLVAYVLGDLMVFRGVAEPAQQNKRNMIATIGDAVLAFVVIWLMVGSLSGAENVLLASIISAVVIAGGEWFFHKYLDKSVFGYDHAAERRTT